MKLSIISYACQNVLVPCLLPCVIFCCFILNGIILNSAYCQDDTIELEVKKVIDKGVQALLNADVKSEETGIYVYTLIKSGVSPEDPKIQAILQQILEKCQTGVYVPTHDHIYETSLDIVALSSLENKEHIKYIQMMVNFLTSKQMDTGGWYYVDIVPGALGDTSMIQYAMLAYWNAGMSGIELDANVLNKACEWLLKYQDPDGGFYYQPHKKDAKKLTMTSAAVGAIGIARLLFHGDRAVKEEQKKPMGVLIDNLSKDETKTIKIKGKANFKPGELDGAADRGIDWLARNYDKTNNPQYIEHRFIYYYCYTMERMTAVHNLKKIGTRDWYQDGFVSLQKTQSPSGLWTDGIGGYAVADTCFALLFLKKATNKVLKRNVIGVGGGLLISGRGLPDNLTDITKSKTGNIAAKKSLGSMDDMLAELEKAEVVDIEATQQAIVETVQLGKPQDLIGQREKLLKLVEHKDPDIRRTAVWALSRCSVLEDAGIFVKKLDDQELDVAVEARNGLCWMSRQINGLGEPAHPRDTLTPQEEWDSVSPERQQEAIKKWRLDAKGAWEKWHFKNRPYELRDDLEEPLPKEK
jgi:hypothetical protein